MCLLGPCRALGHLQPSRLIETAPRHARADSLMRLALRRVDSRPYPHVRIGNLRLVEGERLSGSAGRSAGRRDCLAGVVSAPS